MTDPFPITPPTDAEEAQVADGVRLLHAAADRIDGAGWILPWQRELVALLRDHAREAAEIGPNRFAVALARRIVGEEQR